MQENSPQEANVETIAIPVYNRPYLEKAIDKLNRKAAKLNCKPMVLTFDNPHNRQVDIHPVHGGKLSPPWIIEMVDATLEYQIPTLNGWELVARLDLFSGENGPVVMVAGVPGQEVPQEYNELKRIDCDHCGHKRARKHSILIRKEGKHMQVGSTCVKDFFAGHNPQGFMFEASIMFHNIVGDIDEEKGFGGGSGCYGWDLSTIFTMSAACIRQWGWLSKGKAYESDTPTAEYVACNLNPWPKMPEELKLHEVTEDDKAEGAATLEYWKAMDPGYNDYLQNCCKLIELGYVPARYLGIGVSMVAAYQREAAKLKEMELRRKTAGDSDHVGSVGDRLKGVEVDVIFTRYFDNEWGGNTLYTFRDASGNVYKTFYSGSVWSLETGDKAVIDGTVGKHDDFKGEKQTMLKRVKAVFVD